MTASSHLDEAKVHLAQFRLGGTAPLGDYLTIEVLDSMHRVTLGILVTMSSRHHGWGRVRMEVRSWLDYKERWRDYST